MEKRLDINDIIYYTSVVPETLLIFTSDKIDIFFNFHVLSTV